MPWQLALLTVEKKSDSIFKFAVAEYPITHAKLCRYLVENKKRIRRWDSERELSYDDITRTTKYNRLVHKFQQRSTQLCVGTQVYQSQWNNAMQRPRHSRSFKVTDFGTNRKLIYDFLLVINTNLLPILHHLQVMADYCNLLVTFSLARGECLTLTLSRGWSPVNIAINDISLKTRFFGLHFRCRKYRCIFNHFYAIRPESYRIRWNDIIMTFCQFVANLYPHIYLPFVVSP